MGSHFISTHKTFARGVHPPDKKKLSSDAAVEVLPTPKEIRLPLSQHIGAEAVPVVKSRDEVEPGDLIAKADAFICAPIHTPIRGVIGPASSVTLATGKRVKAVLIKATDEQPLEGQTLYDDVLGGEWPFEKVDQYEPEQIRDAIKSAGIVGLGGAAFPTFVKLIPNKEKPIDTVLVNACECEPYLTSDDRLMLESPRSAICGAMLAAKAVNAEKVVIAVEDNKPLAIAALKKAAEGTHVKICVLQTKYPQGGEKQTVKAALNREIPGGGLPFEIGVVVINIGTVSAIARAVLRGRPLTHRIVTVTGEGVVNPKNVLAPIGAAVSELLDFCGGLKENATRVISGGPMMGFAMGDLETSITKGSSGITVLTDDETEPISETHCVRCGRCVDGCAMGLIPTRIALACRAKNWDLAKRHHIQSCCECGGCAYVCPAGIPLVQLIRMGKRQITD